MRLVSLELEVERLVEYLASLRRSTETDSTCRGHSDGATAPWQEVGSPRCWTVFEGWVGASERLSKYHEVNIGNHS